jgi:hypothetical protein
MEVPALIDLLSRRAELSEEERTRVEHDAIETLLSSNEAVARLAMPLHVYFPESFTLPPVRAALHLALEPDALRIDQRFRVVQPLLATEDRFEEILAHGERLALGARLRVAVLCRRVAELVQAFGPEALLGGARAQTFDRVVAALFRDRDPIVAMHAAWAAGLCGSSPIDEMLDVARGKQSAPHLRRRALVAAVARAFDRDPTALDAVLDSDLIKKEPAARALIVRALAFAPATETATALALELLGGSKAPEVALAAAEHALDREPEAREQILAEVRRKTLNNPPRKLRFLLGPRSALGEQLFTDLVNLRDSAQSSPARAHASAVIALAHTSSIAPAEDGEVAIETLLFDGTRLRDALAATTEGNERRRALWTDWVRAVARSRGRAIDTLAQAKGPTLREALSHATRALDASPRGFGREGAPADTLRTAIAGDAERMLKALGPHLMPSELDGAVARPLAHALVTAIEVDSLSRADAFDNALAIVACTDEAIGRHAAQATAVPRFAMALQGLVSLRAAIDELLSGGPRAFPATLAAALQDAIATIGGASPLRRTLEALVVAVDALVLMSRGELADATGPWSRAIAESITLRRTAYASLGLTAPEAVNERRRTAAIASLCRRDGSKAEGAMPRDNARKTIAAALPPLLCRIHEALETILEKQSRTPSLTKIDFAAGTFVGDFVVDRPLGKGGMGSCLLVRRRVAANDPRAPQFVLKLPLRRDPISISTFIDEATTLLQLTKAPHPGVVEFIACATKSYRLPFLVMGWVEGTTVDERVRKGPMPLGEAIRLGAALADALAHCHRLGITHHDLKPANVVLATRDNRPVLVDFGISSSAQQTGAGSLQYMSPERFSPSKGVTSPSDVFALACLIFETITARALLDPPLHGNERTVLADVATIADAIMAGTPIPTQSVAVYYMTVSHRPEVLTERIRAAIGPGPLFDVLTQMIAQDPAARPKASHVATVLRSMR